MKNFLFIILVTIYSTSVFSTGIKGNVIGTLASKDHFLELWLVEGEPKYLVKDKSGKALTEAISKEHLLALYPELGELVEGGIADDASLGPATHEAPGLPKI